MGIETQADDLQRLVERIEAAEESYFELDLAIAEWTAEQRIPLACYDNSPINYDVRLWMERYGWSPTWSLDNAAMLVPEGCGWLVGWGQTRDDEPMGGAQITRNARFIGHSANYDTIADAEASTPALALCAAALRSRITERQNDG